MIRKVFLNGGLLLLAGAAILATPGSGWAQRGGHFGGGHFGGGRFGGGHFGGGHFGGARLGGYRYGGYRYGYPRAYYPHYGYYHYYPRYRYYPYYGSYYPYYYPYSYNAYPGAWSGYDSGYDGSYGDVTPSYSDGSAPGTPPAGSYQSAYPPAPAQGDSRAHVTVSVPAGARLWFDGTRTTTTGSVREFDSPPLEPGKRYAYEVRARWKEDGREVTQTRQVEVSAGAHLNLKFPVPPGTAGSSSGGKKG